MFTRVRAAGYLKVFDKAFGLDDPERGEFTFLGPVTTLSCTSELGSEADIISPTYLSRPTSAHPRFQH